MSQSDANINSFMKSSWVMHHLCFVILLYSLAGSSRTGLGLFDHSFNKNVMLYIIVKVGEDFFECFLVSSVSIIHLNNYDVIFSCHVYIICRSLCDGFTSLAHMRLNWAVCEFDTPIEEYILCHMHAGGFVWHCSSYIDIYIIFM